MTKPKFGKRLSDEDIVHLLLAIDPEISHVEIKEQFSGAEFVFVTEQRDFTGVFVGHDGDTFQLREANGNVLLLKKSAVIAMRRPNTDLGKVKELLPNSL
jgi:hypothetical protein